MALKNVLPIFQCIKNGVMTGVTLISSPISAIQYKDDIVYQMNWTGTPVGVFTVQVSLDYNPGLPQTDGAPANGNWNVVPAVDNLGNPPIAAGAAGIVTIGLTQIESPYIQIVYTNTSGVGVLQGWVFGKSVGL